MFCLPRSKSSSLQEKIVASLHLKIIRVIQLRVIQLSLLTYSCNATRYFVCCGLNRWSEQLSLLIGMYCMIGIYPTPRIIPSYPHWFHRITAKSCVVERRVLWNCPARRKHILQSVWPAENQGRIWHKVVTSSDVSNDICRQLCYSRIPTATATECVKFVFSSQFGPPSAFAKRQHQTPMSKSISLFTVSASSDSIEHTEAAFTSAVDRKWLRYEPV